MSSRTCGPSPERVFRIGGTTASQQMNYHRRPQAGGTRHPRILRVSLHSELVFEYELGICQVRKERIDILVREMAHLKAGIIIISS